MFTQLEEPAWFVFSKTVKRYKAETIANKFSIRYDIAINESLTFVKDIRCVIKKMNQPNNIAKNTVGTADKMDLASDNIEPVQNNRNPAADNLNKYNFIPFSIHHYRIGNKVIEFAYETSRFEQYLHPLICHFETTEAKNEMQLFELFAFQEQIVFRYNGEVKGIWTKDETHLVKGLIFMCLVNVMHDKTDADWLMTVHASAITNGKKTILFSAPSGNGKTTIAALLQTYGYQLISDDFVPIDRSSFKAHPFPIAMSVKKGSMDLLSSRIPTLEERPLNYISSQKSVRYLAPNHHLDLNQAVYPVKEFIFITYDSSVDFIWKKLDPLTAMKLLIDQSWVFPNPGNVARLFDRILHISFFQLTYSNNQKAVEAITNLFDHD